MPSGGRLREGKLRINEKELDSILVQGAGWAVERASGQKRVSWFCPEESGCLKNAKSEKVSEKAKKREYCLKLGTLGSGNHFIEIQVVDQIFDQEKARAMGILEIGQILISIHTGSRGLGHQVCDDYIRILGEATSRYGIKIPDRQLWLARRLVFEGTGLFSGNGLRSKLCMG